MTLEEQIIALCGAIGSDVKALSLSQGSTSALTTQAKGSIVAAINELVGLVSSGGISDVATSTATDKTWSAAKITAVVDAAKLAVKNDLLGGAGAALDTLAELGAAISNNASFAATIASELSNRVRVDAAQTLTLTQQAQVRSNIGAMAAAAIGNADRDFSAAYAAAKL